MMTKIQIIGAILLALSAACAGGAGMSGGGNTLPQAKSYRASASAQQPRASSAEQVLHRFKGGTDGAEVEAGLIDVNGTLYGTTLFGGATGCGPFTNGCGTIFAVGESGTGYKVVHRFKGGTDGEVPQAAMLDVNGQLYGTTSNGGTGSCSISGTVVGCGTIFTISPSGTGYRVLHRFRGGTDGAVPLYGSLLYENGILYGTTAQGGGTACGGSGCGTVFEIGTSGTGYHTLYAFKGGSSDGASPYFGLVDVNGSLYGTTSSGGGSGCGGSGCGSLFMTSTAGLEQKLHSFKGGNDGASPNGLTSVNGKLYATTYSGGGTGCGGTGCGTVFKIGALGGGYSVLYRFTGSGDGGNPNALIFTGTNLYGTTQSGGTSGQGTVFSVSTSGSENAIYSFAGGSDGSEPTTVDGLASSGTSLYGTTYAGGGSGCTTKYSVGCGTVFEVTP